MPRTQQPVLMKFQQSFQKLHGHHWQTNSQIYRGSSYKRIIPYTMNSGNTILIHKGGDRGKGKKKKKTKRKKKKKKTEQ